MVILQPVIKKGGDSVRSTIAAVVLLQLKFSPPLTNVINCFMEFSLESSFLTSIFRRNLTLPIFKFCCSSVVLFFSSFFALDMEQFEEVLFAPS